MSSLFTTNNTDADALGDRVFAAGGAGITAVRPGGLGLAASSFWRGARRWRATLAAVYHLDPLQQALGYESQALETSSVSPSSPVSLLCHVQEFDMAEAEILCLKRLQK
jgi:hypothetical protein